MDPGLTLFVLVVALDALALPCDLWLRLTGRRMITDYARARPWFGVLIIAAQLAGAAGLAWHFWH